ncbi:MAG: hypothetical protein HY294_14415 [Candidatus Rokubacteria bacterium]|nr:hypothetical protein [Candidatus Rokubacteria bacterium]MBI3827182.1 hypothetical protein [Candidatus Rokubacteria bacterium]
MTAHPLAGHFSVDDAARRIRHYRYAEERTMRILGGWIALTPELPAKLLFGRHVWDCAQHADLWGRRLPELRSPAQQSEPPNEAFVDFMALVETAEEPGRTIERVVGIYRVLKRHLLAEYERHLAHANPVYEPPTRRILQRCIEEERRHVAAGAVVLDRLVTDDAARARAQAWERRLVERLAAARGLGGDVETPALADVAPDSVRFQGDLVALDSTFEPVGLSEDLAQAVDAHARALIDAERSRWAADVAPEAREAVAGEYAALGKLATSEIVAVARIGAHRVVRVRLDGPERSWLVQQQWRRADGQWRLFTATIVRSDPRP